MASGIFFFFRLLVGKGPGRGIEWVQEDSAMGRENGGWTGDVA